jgi:hypothetical protein
MPSYTHSGTTGDTLSSLAVVKCLGPGDFYLRLNNLDNICRQIGWGNAGRHSGRMTKADFEFLAPLMEIQKSITSFKIWNGEKVDYELENRAFHLNAKVWPRNFANQDAAALNVDINKHFKTLQIDPYVDVDTPTVVKGKPICISRNPFYLENIPDITKVSEWNNWIDRNLADQSFFVGLPEDHAWFEDTMKIKVHYEPTSDALSLARLIAGSKMMIANQSMPGTLAVGLGATIWIETRKNTPLDNNEILYPYRANIMYF